MILRALILFFLCTPIFANSPLQPVKTDSPRASMKSFIEAMNDYRKGIELSDPKLQGRIEDALRTFDLDGITHTEKKSYARMAAIYLKEVVDRVIVIDYEKIPDEQQIQAYDVKKWRLKDTEISIGRVVDGARVGEYLFTPDTIERASSFYQKVKELPYLAGSGKGALYQTPWYDKKLPSWLVSESFYVPNWQLLGVLLILLLGMFLKSLVVFFMEQFKKLSYKSKSSWDDRFIDASEESVGAISACLLWLFGVRILNFEGISFFVLDIVLKILLSFYAIRWLYRLTDVLSDMLEVQAKKTEFPLDDQMVPILRKTLKIFTVIVGSLVAVQNLGVNVMSVLAGLGLGGLAFALAAKDTCANLFGSIMILMDKPCRVGDWVNIGGVEGTVEEIGFRSTKIRTLGSSLVSVPNANLANMNIDNFGARSARILKLCLGVTYDTLPEELEAFVQGVQGILLNNPYTLKDKIQVYFHGYGASSLDVLVVAYLNVPGRDEELAERHRILTEILRFANELGVSFAFPSQSLYLESTPERPLAEKAKRENSSLRAFADSYSSGGASAKERGLGIFRPNFEK